MKQNFFLALSLFAAHLHAEPINPESVSFTTHDGGTIHADYYPAGDKGIILAHGAVFNKESWGVLVKTLTAHKISALAIDFRGYGQSRAGDRPGDLYEDILAAVVFLQNQKNINDIAVLGASMGGAAAADAAVHAQPGDISRLALLSPAPIAHPENILAGAILYLASRNENSAAKIAAQFQLAPEPKQLKWLEGGAHAQHIFKTLENAALTQAIMDFLTAAKP